MVSLASQRVGGIDALPSFFGVDDAVIVRAPGGKHVYNSETWEKAFFERLKQRTAALDAARGCPRPRGWLYLVRNTIYLVSSCR
jgi:hypothetical protein